MTRALLKVNWIKKTTRDQIEINWRDFVFMWRKVTCENFKTCRTTASDRGEVRSTGGAKEA